MTKSAASPLRTWLQLLRAPNLFTVPGDPLAGYLLASAGIYDIRLPMVIVASLCFYAYGLLLNDLADLEEDRRDRPNRPLPSGAANPATVWAVTGTLAIIGLLIAWVMGRMPFLVALALASAIALYNLWGKKIAVFGPLNMGLCRGLSFLLGVSVFLDPRNTGMSYALPKLAVGAIGLTLYIAAVTNLARNETQANPPLLPRQIPFFTLFPILLGFSMLSIRWEDFLTSRNLYIYAVAAYTIYAAFKIHSKLTRHPAPPIPPMIGQLIRLLLPLQALYCLGVWGNIGKVCAIVLLILWPISRSVSRRFYAS